MLNLFSSTLRKAATVIMASEFGNAISHQRLLKEESGFMTDFALYRDSGVVLVRRHVCSGWFLKEKRALLVKEQHKQSLEHLLRNLLNK